MNNIDRILVYGALILFLILHQSPSTVSQHPKEAVGNYISESCTPIPGWDQTPKEFDLVQFEPGKITLYVKSQIKKGKYVIAYQGECK